jgi:hypothetical protein
MTEEHRLKINPHILRRVLWRIFESMEEEIT